MSSAGTPAGAPRRRSLRTAALPLALTAHSGLTAPVLPIGHFITHLAAAISSVMAVERPVSTAIVRLSHGARRCRATLCSTQVTPMSVSSADGTPMEICWSSTAPAVRTMWSSQARPALRASADLNIMGIEECVPTWDAFLFVLHQKQQIGCKVHPIIEICFIETPLAD